ncbi:DUF4102 domain-containing protein [Acetobacteraceae bacterium]|nr:DUF4102 domain-containing protein [Acetobacteraceae bacterium]
MARMAPGKLWASQVKNFGDGVYYDGGNLSLVITNQRKGRQWTFKYTSPLTKKRRQMGIGSAFDISLEKAREIAASLRAVLRSGKDPLDERLKEKQELKVQMGSTFQEMAELYLKKNKPHWRGDHTFRHAKNTLESYALPVFGDRPAASIIREDLVSVISPIYNEKKADTVRKLYRYIRKVLELSKVEGARDAEIPQWKGDLEHTFPNLSNLKPVKHHEALKPEEVSPTMQRLKEAGGMGALVCRFIMLTGCRSIEGRGARWDEINLKEKLWTVQGERMKKGNLYSVPLSKPILDLLEEIKPLHTGKPNALLFSSDKGKALSDAGVLKSFKAARPQNSNAVVHGLRSTFRDWIGDETDYPEELGEYALAHAKGSKTERAYRRNTAVEKRRPLMEDWGKFCMGEID